MIHAEITQQLSGTVDQGKKSSNFAALRVTALLTEVLFINTEMDATRLKNSAFLKQVALGYVNGIAKSFRLKYMQYEREDRHVLLAVQKLVKVGVIGSP